MALSNASRRNWLSLLGASVASLSAPRPSLAVEAGAVVLSNCTLFGGRGTPQVGQDLLISGGKVQQIGAGLQLPASAQKLDAGGALVSPGFIAAQTALGLVEINAEALTRDHSPDDITDPLRAAFDARDGANPRSTLLNAARLGGVTAAISTPGGGLVSGSSVVLATGGTPIQQRVGRHAVAVHATLGDWELSAVGGTRPGALSRLREALEDARLLANNEGAFERRQLRTLNGSRGALTRLGQVLKRKLPLVVRASRASTLLRLVELAEEFDISLVLAGAEEGHRVAPQLASANIPVLVEPLSNLPSHFSRLASRADNATLLHQAGVRVSLMVEDAHLVSTLRQQAGNAVARGLPWRIAMEGLTRAPADAFGLSEYGRIEVGNRADLVLWDGDPMELSSAPRAMWINGQAVQLRSRQTALFERYRTRGSGKGGAGAPR